MVDASEDGRRRTTTNDDDQKVQLNAIIASLRSELQLLLALEVDLLHSMSNCSVVPVH